MAGTVAITGAGGYLGTNLVPLLVEQGREVVAIDRRVPDVSSSDGAGSEGVRWVGACLRPAAPPYRRVLTAGDRPRAGGVRPVEVDGGAAAPGRGSQRARCRHLQPDRDLRSAGLRRPEPAQPDRPGRCGRAAAGGRGGRFDLVDVRDVARGLVLAAEHGRRGENYLLPGHRWRILDLCRQAAALAGRRGPRWSLPMGVARRLAPVLDAPLRWAGIDAMSPHAMMALDAFPEVDGSKAARELGYRPRPPEETLQDLVRFLVEQGWLDGRRRSRRAWARSQPTVSPTGRSTTAATASSSTSCRS